MLRTNFFQDVFSAQIADPQYETSLRVNANERESTWIGNPEPADPNGSMQLRTNYTKYS